MFCNSFPPIVATINIGPAVEQKLQAKVARSVSAFVSDIAFAPMGYPHKMLVKNTLSQLTPNNTFVKERFRFLCNLRVSVVNTIKGNNAGSTLNAHIVMPFTKLCIYFAGAETNIISITVNSSVEDVLKVFTSTMYLEKYTFMFIFASFIDSNHFTKPIIDNL